MGATFRLLGFQEGQRQASYSRNTIRSVHKRDLPRLAGKALESEAEDPMYQFESWQEGFWEGWMTRAEELRGDGS